MTNKHILIGAAVYYGGFALMAMSGVSLVGGGLLTLIFILYVGTIFPISPLFLGLCFRTVRARQAAEAAHQHELDMQDRLARRIALETNGPAPTPTADKEPIGFRVPTAKKGSA